MGTLTNTAAFSRASTVPAQSAGGGKRRVTFIGTCSLSNSYATGGDTLTTPTPPTNFVLRGVKVLNECDGTRRYHWNGNTVTPKIQSYTAFATESVATTDLSAVTGLVVELMYEA